MARDERTFRAQHQKQTGMEGVSEERIQSPSGEGQSIFFTSQWVCERQPAAHEQQLDAKRMFLQEAGQ